MHPLDRLKQRYGISLTLNQLKRLKDNIWKGKSRYICDTNGGEQIHALYWCQDVIYAIVDMDHHCIKTFITKGMVLAYSSMRNVELKRLERNFKKEILNHE